MSDTQRPAMGPTEPQDGLPAFIPYPMPRTLWRAFGEALKACGLSPAKLAALAARMQAEQGHALSLTANHRGIEHQPDRMRRLMIATALDSTDVRRGVDFLRAMKDARPAVFGLDNRAMESAINSGACVDVRGCERTPEGHYVLPAVGFAAWREGADFADSDAEAWIWSIGRDNATGRTLASTTADFYQRDGFTCLFLR